MFKHMSLWDTFHIQIIKSGRVTGPKAHRENRRASYLAWFLAEGTKTRRNQEVYFHCLRSFRFPSKFLTPNPSLEGRSALCEHNLQGKTSLLGKN